MEIAADIYVEEMKTEGLVLGYNYSKVDCDLVKESFIDGANWEKEHSYSEQEVISMLESLRQRCGEEAAVKYIDSDINEGTVDCEVDAQSILTVEYKYLLK